MSTSRWLVCGLVLAMVAGAGCKKKKEGAGKTYQRALQRLQSAVDPGEFEWPLQRFGEIAKGDAGKETKLGAQFELARGWLTLGLLTQVEGPHTQAAKVLQTTGWKEKAIIENFDAVVAAGKIEGTDLVAWAKEGARLARAVRSNEGTRERRLTTITEVALGGGVFSPIAVGWIFSEVREFAVRAGPNPKALKEKKLDRSKIDRQLRAILRHACPTATAQLIARKDGPDRPARSASWAAACTKEAAWLGGKTPDEVAKAGPCAGLEPSKGSSPEARTMVVAFFGALTAALAKGGQGQKPPSIYKHFQPDQGCGSAKLTMDWLLAPDQG